MKYLRIEEFAEVITGGTPSTSVEEYWNGDVPWLNSGELNRGIIDSSSNFITKEGLSNCSAKIMPVDSVLIALTGTTTGVTAMLKIEACANQSVTGILPSKHHIPKYLYYYLSSIRNKIISESYGGAQKHISQGFVKKILVPLPSIEDQKHIVKILDEADTLRQKRKQAIGLLDDYLKSVFLEMFGDPVKNPKRWRIEKLKDICNKITDGTHDTPKRVETGIKFITGKHIRPFKIDYNNSDYVSIEDHNEIYRRCNPEKDDILYTNIGVNLGTAAVNTVDYPFSMKNVALLKLSKEKVNSYYLASVLNFEFMRNDILRKLCLGGAQQFLALQDINKIEIPVADILLQNKFEAFVSKIDLLKQKMINQYLELENQFHVLMQKAFKGEL